MVAILLMVIIGGCQPEEDYNRNYSFDRTGWHQDSTRCFSPIIISSQQPVSFIIDIRNNNLYPYQNLYLLLEMTTPSHTIVRDTIEGILSDATGQMTGKVMLGSYSHQIVWMERYIARDSGCYQISIRQGMRMRLLPGIEDIGLRMKSLTP